nr:hypothetical protein [Chlamydiota bacterium]
IVIGCKDSLKKSLLIQLFRDLCSNLKATLNEQIKEGAPFGVMMFEDYTFLQHSPKSLSESQKKKVEKIFQIYLVKRRSLEASAMEKSEALINHYKQRGNSTLLARLMEQWKENINQSFMDIFQDMENTPKTERKERQAFFKKELKRICMKVFFNHAHKYVTEELTHAGCSHLYCKMSSGHRDKEYSLMLVFTEEPSLEEQKRIEQLNLKYNKLSKFLINRAINGSYALILTYRNGGKGDDFDTACAELHRTFGVQFVQFTNEVFSPENLTDHLNNHLNVLLQEMSDNPIKKGKAALDQLSLYSSKLRDSFSKNSFLKTCNQINKIFKEIRSEMTLHVEKDKSNQYRFEMEISGSEPEVIGRFKKELLNESKRLRESAGYKTRQLIKLYQKGAKIEDFLQWINLNETKIAKAGSSLKILRDPHSHPIMKEWSKQLRLEGIRSRRIRRELIEEFISTTKGLHSYILEQERAKEAAKSLILDEKRALEKQKPKPLKPRKERPFVRTFPHENISPIEESVTRDIVAPLPIIPTMRTLFHSDRMFTLDFRMGRWVIKDWILINKFGDVKEGKIIYPYKKMTETMNPKQERRYLKQQRRYHCALVFAEILADSSKEGKYYFETKTGYAFRVQLTHLENGVKVEEWGTVYLGINKKTNRIYHCYFVSDAGRTIEQIYRHQINTDPKGTLLTQNLRMKEEGWKKEGGYTLDKNENEVLSFSFTHSDHILHMHPIH